jgi:hypothetical protein
MHFIFKRLPCYEGILSIPLRFQRFIEKLNFDQDSDENEEKSEQGTDGATAQ